MRLQSAIFDMDGTLLDSMQVWVHVGEQYLRNLSLIHISEPTRRS